LTLVTACIYCIKALTLALMRQWEAILIIGVVSQKGGVCKSTIVRLLSREYSDNDWNVKIADMDSKQGTCTRWNMTRNDSKIEPVVKTEQYRSVKDAIGDYQKNNIDLMIFDGAPSSSTLTLQIAKESNLIILPTGISVDDLEPTVKLAHELIKHNIERNRIIIVFCRVGDSTVELSEAKQYIEQSGFKLIKAVLPDRVAYRRAQDIGKSVSETNYKTLNQKASNIVQELVNLINKLK